MRSPRLSSPPRLAVWLVKRFDRYRTTHAIIDDMQEVFARICRDRGNIAACLWYWAQCLDAVIKNTLFNLRWRFIMMKNYLKIALRNMRRHKGYSLLNISGLVLGLVCFILVSLYVQYELSYDKYHEHYKRIFRIINCQPEKNYMNSDYFAWTQGPLAPTLMDRYPEVESAVRMNMFDNQLIVYGKDSFLADDFYFADPEIFEIFSLELQLGNPKTALDNPDSIIISEATARRIFGNRNPLGKILKYENSTDLIVTGVLRDMPQNSHFRVETIVPFINYMRIREMDPDRWTPGWYCYTYCLLKEGTVPDVLEDKLVGLSTEVFKKNNIESKLVLQPLERIHLHSNINGEISANGNIKYVVLFSSIAFLLLLIACTNYMNLGTARSIKRGREVGIRKVVGAQRSQLVKQFLGESIVMTMIAFILSIAVVWIVLPPFNLFFERDITFDLLGSFKFLPFLLALILFTGVVSGGYPALIISSSNPSVALRETSSKRSKGGTLRSSLVVFQFAISIILIICTLVVKNQLVFIQNKDVGYTKDRIVILRLRDRELWRNIDTIKTELLKNSQVLAVSGSNYLPNDIRSFSRFPRPDKPDNSDDSLLIIYTADVDYDFIDLYGLEITQGRNFLKEFVSDPKEAVLINETAARALGWKNLDGQRLKHQGSSFPEIIGVLKDFNFHSLHNEISPLCLYLNPRYPFHLSIKIKGDNIPETLKYIQGRIEAISSDYPFEYRFFDDIFDQAYRNELGLESLFMVCAGMAVFIACLGLLGLVAFSAEQRTKEIGIRKVMGASVSNIIQLLSKQFLKLILLANALSWPIAFCAMRKWLQNFAYRVNIGIGVFVVSALIVLFIALATLGYQSIKAATANPVDSLRYE
jgi:putative ABC transport system permease protein